MATTAAEIETIVRVVIERLRAVEAAPTTRSTSPSVETIRPAAAPANDSLRSQPSRSPSAEPAIPTLRLNLPLVTLEQVTGQLVGIQVVEIPRKSVVTPAVVDELKQRRVKLKRIDSQSSNPTNRQRTLLVVAPKGKLLAPLSGATVVESADADTDLKAIAAHLAQFDSDHQVEGVPQVAGVIWCSPQPFAAVSATRTLTQLTVVRLASLAELEQAVAECQPNVLVIDSRHWSYAATANLARAWKVQK